MARERVRSEFARERERTVEVLAPPVVETGAAEDKAVEVGGVEAVVLAVSGTGVEQEAARRDVSS